jgi:quinoprotein glucose dehydrogenase
MLYVFDRVTGKPVWPIEERPVPQSTVPGEHTSATQPFSVQFPPISPLGVTTDDLVDFTPAMRQEAEEIVSHYVMGPAFTPPSLVDPALGGKRGSLVLPGVFGSGNWNTSAFDPETSMYYTVAKKEVNVYGLYKPVEPDATLPFAVLDQNAYSDPFPDVPKWGLPKQVTLKNGIPIPKPPYGTISAYNISKGERIWIAPSGDDV